MNRQELAQEIFKVSHLTGSFLLRSGQTSNEYFDKYQFECRPLLLKEIAKALAPLVPKQTEVLAGLEMGGIPIATALSFELGLPVSFVRKAAKKYGTCLVAEGFPVANKNVCVVEDVITTGGQVLISSEDLRKMGAQISDCLCVIYRGPKNENPLATAKLKLTSLFTADELKSAQLSI